MNPIQRSSYAAVRWRGHYSGVRHAAVHPTQRSSYTAVATLRRSLYTAVFGTENRQGPSFADDHTRSGVLLHRSNWSQQQTGITKQSPLIITEKVQCFCQHGEIGRDTKKSKIGTRTSPSPRVVIVCQDGEIGQGTQVSRAGTVSFFLLNLYLHWPRTHLHSPS